MSINRLKMWHLYKNGALPCHEEEPEAFVSKWMQFENIILSEEIKKNINIKILTKFKRILKMAYIYLA